VWVDDGEELSRYDYLTILVRGYTDMGLQAPAAELAEYRALVAEKVAELRRQQELRERWLWYALPKWQQPKFTDVSNV